MAYPSSGYTSNSSDYSILRNGGFNGNVDVRVQDNGSGGSPAFYSEIESAVFALAYAIKAAYPGDTVTVERNHTGILSQGTVYTA